MTTVITTPHYNLLSSASALLATITFGFMWFSRLPTTTEILMGIFLLYGQSWSLMPNNLKLLSLQEDTLKNYRLPTVFRVFQRRRPLVPI